MAQDSGFWRWRTDRVATRRGARRFAIGASVLYSAGAGLLLGQTVFAWPATVALAGVGLLLAGVAGSVGVLGSVLVTRSRLSFH